MAIKPAISALDQLTARSEELLDAAWGGYREGAYGPEFPNALKAYNKQLEKVESFLKK